MNSIIGAKPQLQREDTAYFLLTRSYSFKPHNVFFKAHCWLHIFSQFYLRGKNLQRIIKEGFFFSSSQPSFHLRFRIRLCFSFYECRRRSLFDFFCIRARKFWDPHFEGSYEIGSVMEGLESCFDLTGSPFVLASFESHVWNFRIPWKLSISFCPRLAESPSSTLNQVPGYSLERLLPSCPRRLHGLFQLQWPKP